MIIENIVYIKSFNYDYLYKTLYYILANININLINITNKRKKKYNNF